MFEVDNFWDRCFGVRWTGNPGPPDLKSALKAAGLELGPTTEAVPIERLEEGLRDEGWYLVVEPDYYDIDIRSELRFLVNRMHNAPSVSSPRIHVFSRLNGLQSSPKALQLRDQIVTADYLGYLVIRLRRKASLGRTMLAPGVMGLEPTALRCSCDEWVNVLGVERKVTAMPFVEQDSVLSSCFHANVFMAAYMLTLRGLLPRTTSGEIGSGSAVAGRDAGIGAGSLSFPNEAVSFQQAVPLASDIGLVSTARWLSDTSSDDLKAELESHLNSGFPVSIIYDGLHYLANDNDNNDDNNDDNEDDNDEAGGIWDRDQSHSVLVCGFKRDGAGGAINTLIVHDDQAGLYREVPFDDLYLNRDGTPTHDEGDWDEKSSDIALLFYAPQGVWLSSRVASSLAANNVKSSIKGTSRLIERNSKLSTGIQEHLEEKLPDSPLNRWDDDYLAAFLKSNENLSRLYEKCQTALDRLLDSDRFRVRSYATLGTVYKASFLTQNDPSIQSDIANMLAVTPLPKFVWVCEFMDIDRWASPRMSKCVAGEVLVDASSSNFEHRVIWIRSGRALITEPTTDQTSYMFDPDNSFSRLTYSCRTLVKGSAPPGQWPPFKTATRSGM